MLIRDADTGLDAENSRDPARHVPPVDGTISA